MRVIVQPLPMNLTWSANPTPTAVTTMATSTQMPVTKPATATAKTSLLPVTVYNLAQCKFKEIPYSTRKSQEEESPSTPQQLQSPKAAAVRSYNQCHSPADQRRTPHGQIPSQPLLTYLLKGHHGQLPPIMMKSQHPPL